MPFLRFGSLTAWKGTYISDIIISLNAKFNKKFKKVLIISWIIRYNDIEKELFSIQIFQ
jgi:hypothetical protein